MTLYMYILKHHSYKLRFNRASYIEECSVYIHDIVSILCQLCHCCSVELPLYVFRFSSSSSSELSSKSPGLNFLTLSPLAPCLLPPPPPLLPPLTGYDLEEDEGSDA